MQSKSSGVTTAARRTTFFLDFTLLASIPIQTKGNNKVKQQIRHFKERTCTCGVNIVLRKWYEISRGYFCQALQQSREPSGLLGELGDAVHHLLGGWYWRVVLCGTLCCHDNCLQGLAETSPWGRNLRSERGKSTTFITRLWCISLWIFLKWNSNN